MDPYRFHQYLTDKLRALKEYLSISEAMKIGLSQSDMEAVSCWMAKRHGLMERINRMDQELAHIADQPALSQARWPAGLRAEVQQLYRAIEDVLYLLKAVDEECHEQIMILRNEVKAELQKAFEGMVTVRGYRGSPARSPQFLDVRS